MTQRNDIVTDPYDDELQQAAKSSIVSEGRMGFAQGGVPVLERIVLEDDCRFPTLRSYTLVPQELCGKRVRVTIEVLPEG